MDTEKKEVFVLKRGMMDLGVDMQKVREKLQQNQAEEEAKAAERGEEAKW